MEGERHSPIGNRLGLSGRTIVITRAQSQSRDVVERLESLGANVVSFPTIEFVEPADWGPLDAAVSNLTGYDWIVFTSANGVRFFIGRIRERHADSLDAMRSSRIAAIGPATARALETEGLKPVLVAEDSKAEGALAAIVRYAGGEANVNELRFLIPRAAVAREVLPVGLRVLGAEVDAVEAYRTIKPAEDVTRVVRLFEEGRVDALTFTSSSTVSNFAAMVETTDLSRFLLGVLVVCIGPVTAATATEHGLRDVIHPEKYTADALAEVLVKALA